MAGKKRKVALLGGYSPYQTKVIAGITRYWWKIDNWDVVANVGPKVFVGTSRLSLRSLAKFSGDGILYVGVDSPKTSDVRTRLEKLKIPVVYAAPFRDIGYKPPCVVADDRAAGRIMAEHFLSKGLRHFAFYTQQKGCPPMEAREAGFTERVAAEGYSCHVLREKYPATITEMRGITARLGEWLQSLPKPVGVGACFDGYAADVIEICLSWGIRIPEEVAVVGVNNDPSVCDAISPTLSSIDLNLEEGGFQAAALLDRLMAGDPAPPEPILIAPKGVVQRQSSDMVAVEDPVVARCVHYIRRHVADGVTVGDLLDKVHVSQSSLQARFKKLLGHTPSVEIRRARIEKARELLADTDLSMTQIAYACGFKGQNRFGVVFRQRIGQTPTAYRKRIREV